MVNKLEPDALTPSDGIPGYVLAAAGGGAGRPRRGTTGQVRPATVGDHSKTDDTPVSWPGRRRRRRRACALHI